MARTNFVKAYRGQRKCQHKTEWQVCGKPKPVHSELDHEFTQAPLTCEACRQPINIGDPYKWVAPRAHRAAKGIKRNRHTSCPGWKPSELTSSPHLATIYAAQENADKEMAAISIGSVDEAESVVEVLEQIATDFAESIMEAAESYGESADAIEDGFGHETYQSDELREKSEAVEGWADEVASFSVYPFDEEFVCDDCGEPESVEEHEDEEHEDYHEYVADEGPLQDWLADAVDELSDLIGNNPI